jgi:hypothetical protein
MKEGDRVGLVDDIAYYLEKQATSLDSKILVITTAYEQGFGKGEQRIKCDCPYTVGDWLGCDIAWNLGYEEGKSKAAKPVQEPFCYFNQRLTNNDTYTKEKPAQALTPPWITSIPLYTSLQSREPMSDAKDAERYQWLKTRLLGADFDWQERCVLVFDWPKDVGVGSNCDMNIDAAMDAHNGIGVKA